MELRTDRLVLRPLDAARDAAALHDAYTDDETMAWWHLPRSPSLDETARRVEQLARDAAQFAICVDDGAPAIGHVGWLTAARDRNGAFGYLLARDHWGKGFATEAATAALEHGFGTLGAAGAELWVYEGNRRSAALAERLGATLQGRFVAFNLARGRAFDTIVYGIRAPGSTERARVADVIASIEVADVAAAIDFWTTHLGFDIEFALGDPPSMVSLARGDSMANRGVVRFRAGSADGPPLVGMLDVLAPDVDAMYDEVVAAGAPITQAIDTKPWGLREFTVVDPNGVRVRFYAPALV